VQAAPGASTGGRPPARLEFNAGAGVVLAADVGATHSRVAVADLAGAIVGEVAGDLEVALGPDVFLGWLADRFDELLASTPAPLRGIGVGLPGPVEYAAGRPVNPPIMPGWDGHPVADRLSARHGVPVLVDNDVNVMAVGEHSRHWPDCPCLLYVKVGTGIGCGIVIGGRVHRGAQGAAGDIGHLRVGGHDEVVCHCGNVGCLEAVAGGGALAAQARALGLPARDSRELVALVRAHDRHAVRLVRQAGRLIGEVVAHLVNVLNPAVIVIGGDVADADEQLFAGVREVVYQRSTPLANRHLQIVHSQLDDRAGVAGAAVMAIEHALAPEAIDRGARAP